MKLIAHSGHLENHHSKSSECSDNETSARKFSQNEHFVFLLTSKQGQCGSTFTRDQLQPDRGKLVFQFVGSFGAGLCRNNCGSDNHSDKRQSNQEIMHCGVSLCGSSEPVHKWIIGLIRKNLNPTKTGSLKRLVLCASHLGGISTGCDAKDRFQRRGVGVLEIS
jgi:hypothetical protein